MDIKGKVCVFPKVVGKDNVTIFETTLNRKEGEEYKDSYSIRLNFSKEILPDSKKKFFKEGFVYIMEIEGFLATRAYQTKDGENKVVPTIIVTKAKTLESKEIKKPNQDEAVEDKLPL